MHCAFCMLKYMQVIELKSFKFNIFALTLNKICLKCKIISFSYRINKRVQ